MTPALSKLRAAQRSLATARRLLDDARDLLTDEGQLCHAQMAIEACDKASGLAEAAKLTYEERWGASERRQGIGVDEDVYAKIERQNDEALR